MKAIVFDSDNGPHLDEDYPQPSPGPGQVVVAVETVGICRTDLEILKGYMGFTDLISCRFDLDDGIEALRAAADGRNIKVLIDVEQ